MKEQMQWEEDQSFTEVKEYRAVDLDNLDQRIMEEPIKAEHPIFETRVTYKPPVAKMALMKLFPYCGKLSIFATYLLFEPHQFNYRHETPEELFRIEIDAITKVQIKKVGLTKNMYIETNKATDYGTGYSSNGTLGKYPEEHKEQ